MKSNPNFQKFNDTVRRITEETYDQIGHEVIIRTSNGYKAYSDFDIVQVGDEWHVRSPFKDPIVFSQTKSALAWCIASKAGRWHLARLIQFLDHKLACKQEDIQILTHHLKNCTNDEETRGILQCRLSEDIYARQSYKAQLQKSINHAKHLKNGLNIHTVER